MPPQLQKAASRRMNRALPRVGATNTNQDKVATFAEPGFKKSNLLRKIGVGEAIAGHIRTKTNDGAPISQYDSRQNSEKNRNKGAIQRRLRK